MNQSLIKDIKQALSKKLPGLSAQKKMAPRMRFSHGYDAKPSFAKQSAVLILIYFTENQAHIALIQRGFDDGLHSGQIAFPGGKQEKIDNSLIDTALREAWEEVGIVAKNVEVLGKLTPLYIPISNFSVQPVVAFAEKRPTFNTNPAEVRQLIELNIKDLQNKANIHLQKIPLNRNGKKTVMEAPAFVLGEHVIWGATAMILSEFLEILNPEH